nr:monodechloroaminopyrrolnitrin synthase PrnB family protein [uncultured Dyadobacter sp.]
MRPSCYSVSDLKSVTNENEWIASLDPLRADDVMARIPRMNEKRDVKGLVSIATMIMPAEPDLRGFGYHEANAATRDIGILLGSLKRHGIEPHTVVDGLADKMLWLAAKTSLPPRDTLLHYTIWNPVDDRRRTYTGTADEIHLIDSVVMAMDPLVAAIRLLGELHYTSLHARAFREICEKVTNCFQKVIDGIVLARRKVSLSYFSSELRLYFDPITLDGRQYLGPGAVEMPMFIFDHLLWSSDCKDPEYAVFKNTYLPYVHPEMRGIYLEFDGKDSLLGKCLKNIVDERMVFNPVVCESLRALRLCFQQLKSFRMPHRKVAEEAYDHVNGQGHASESSRHEYRHKGSGGYSPGILSHIVGLTNAKIAKLDECIALYQLRSGRSDVDPD